MISPLLRKFPPSRLGKLIEPEFIFGAHLQAVEHHVLDMYVDDLFNNLSIQLPIRHSKSTYAACICLWLLLINPEERILIASFSSTASEDILRKVKEALLAWGPKINRVSIDPKNCRVDYFKILGHTGECRAVSIGSRFSQATATTIIVDDLYTEESAASVTQRQTVEDWFFGTLLNRRTRSKRGEAKVISTMTPRHPEDVLAKLHDTNKTASGQNKWVIHRQPAIKDGQALFPELWPMSLLLGKRQELEDAGKQHIWETVWMCNPQTGGLTEWPMTYFPESMWFNNLPMDLPTKLRAMACDPSKGSKSKTGDDTAVVGGHYDSQKNLWLTELYMRPGDDETACIQYTEMIKAFRPHVASMETAQFQVALARDVRRRLDLAGVRCDLKPYDPGTENKEARIRQLLSGMLRNHKLKVLDCPYGRRLVAQLRAFPTGDHDDGPDALAQLVDLIDNTLRN